MKARVAIACALLGIGSVASADAPKDAKAPAKMEMPKPSKELADMAKGLAGNWKCTGRAAMDPSNLTAMVDIKGTYKTSTELDGFWVKGEWTGTATGVPGTMKGTMFTTHDGKKWFRVSLDNMGGHEWTASTGTGTKLVWDGEMTMMGATAKTRSTEEVAAGQVKITSEVAMDGKKYVPVFELTCKK